MATALNLLESLPLNSAVKQNDHRRLIRSSLIFLFYPSQHLAIFGYKKNDEFNFFIGLKYLFPLCYVAYNPLSNMQQKCILDKLGV